MFQFFSTLVPGTNNDLPTNTPNDAGGQPPNAPPPVRKPPSPGHQYRYRFTHYWLPGLFYSDTERFMTTIARDGVKFLEFAWGGVASQLDRSQWMLPDQFEYESYTLENGAAVALITFSRPIDPLDAYFVAAVYRAAQATEPTLRRYFTLELGGRPGGTPHALLCEWVAPGAHQNHGLDLPPTKAAFLQAIVNNLQSQEHT